MTFCIYNLFNRPELNISHPGEIYSFIKFHGKFVISVQLNYCTRGCTTTKITCNVVLTKESHTSNIT